MPIKHKKIKEVESGIWQLDNGGYLVDFRPNGNAKRFRKIQDTKADARRYKAWVISQYINNPEWTPKTLKKDNRRLNALIDLWYEVYGQFLSDGKRRKTKLFIVSDLLGNPVATSIDKAMLADYRTRRAEQVSLKTINNEHGYLCSLFNKLIDLGKWKKENPIAGVSKFKLPEPELSYLSEAQIKALLENVNAEDHLDLTLIVDICLSTGARWSEAQNLHSRNVQNGAVQYTHTKGKTSRWVRIEPELEAQLKARGSGPLFAETRIEKRFERCLKKAGIELPAGQLTHVLRHTFATHYLANGGDIRTLKDILGHKHVNTTMKYLKVVTALRDKVITLNPLSMLRSRDREQPALKLVSQ